MNSIQHRAPLWAQLFIALFYFTLIGFVSCLDSGVTVNNNLIDPSEILKLKISLALGVGIAFIFPVVLFSYVLRAEKAAFIPLKIVPNWQSLLVAFTICLFALPLVSFTMKWNAGMQLPSFMSGVEEWMRVKENAANQTTKLLFVNNTIGNMVVNLIVVAFMAGLSEEIFFRGFLQKLFIENKMNKHLAVWLTAILFSAIHIQFFGFIPRMLLGAVLGYLYLFTNNLWVPIIAHAVNNSIGVIIAYITGNIESDPLTKNGEQDISLTLVISSVALIVIQLVFLSKVQAKKYSQTPSELA